MTEHERPLRPGRIPFRAVATALGVFALLAPFADSWGLASAVLATLVGVFVGEAVAYSRTRLPVGLVVAAVAFAGASTSAWVLVQWPISSAILGGPRALILASIIGLGGGTFAAVTALRLSARRVRTVQAVELGLLALATATAFAAHRDGALARPLWLTDRAWQLGVDPSDVLLAVGAVAALALAMLQLLETRHRLPWFSWVWLPAIAVVAFVLADVSTSETPTSEDLEAIQSALDGTPAAGAAGTEDGDQAGTPPPASSDGDEPATPKNGEADPKPVTLGEDGEPVKPEPGDGDPLPAAPDGAQPAEPEPGDGEPRPERPGDQPATPEPGDGTADAQGDQPGSPADGDGTARPDDGDGDGEPEDAAPDDGEPEDGEPTDNDDPTDDEAEDPPPPPKEQPDVNDAPSESDKPRNTPVAVLLLGDDYEPMNGYFYLRQEVESEFTGKRLVPSDRVDVDRDIVDDFPLGPTPVDEPPPLDGRKVVHGKVAILAEHSAPFALDAAISYEPAYNPNPARFMRAWTFIAHAPTTPYEDLLGHTSGASWTDDVRAHYLAYPTDDPRYAELAERLVSGLKPELQDDPFAKALVIKQHLDQMAYDTSERHAEAADPTAEFLFDEDEMVGYCVHAAHAATYLMRAVDVPARIGTGYAVEEERRRGSSLVVMGKDAHAWPELYLDGVGWTILDVAPAENRDPPAEPMDEEANDLLSDMAREEPATEAVASYDWRGLWYATVRTLRNLAIALGALVVVGHYLIKLWRRSRPYVATHRGIARVGYRAAIDRLTEAGHTREHGETREAFARRVAEAAPSFVTVTKMHVAATLGHPDAVSPRSTSQWLRQLSSMNRELARSSRWTRWLGVANPFSFYRSR